jgi:hypothetical protein
MMLLADSRLDGQIPTDSGDRQHPADAPEAIALSEEIRRRRAKLTKEEEASLRAQIDTIQNAHGGKRIVWEQAVGRAPRSRTGIGEQQNRPES